MATIRGLEEFADPPAAYRQMFIWSWNSVMTPERITRMLEQFAARGVGGAFVHARPGLVTEYLSDEWWALWSHASAECRRLGLECQIYDENSFPSAFAGGHVMAHRPHLGARRLTCVTSEAEDPPAQSVIATVGGDVSGGPFKLVVTPEPASARMGGFPFVDILNPEATREFLAVTHEEYAKRFAGQFGTSVKYVFTDEPDLRGGDGFHWTPHLVAEFQREHGYDLRARLFDLGFGTASSSEVRFDYWSTVNRLFVESFARPVYEWCAKHNLRLTGHYGEHTWPSPARQPSAMALLRWMQAPGIDLPGFQFDHRDRDKSVACLPHVKEVASVANQLGCERMLGEGYGGRGYDMAIRDFKPITDYLIANGVNLNAPHLSHVSVAGVRKYEWPQTLSDHSSWWDEYRLVADHDARLAYATCRGRTRNRVLVLRPTTSAWIHYVPKSFDVTTPTHRDTAWMDVLGESQLSLIRGLADSHVDFDLGDEFVIAELGSARDGTLTVGACTYDLVVMPEMVENVIGSTLDVLRAYLASGGTVLAMGEPPTRVKGRLSDAGRALAAEHADHWVRVRSRGELVDQIRRRVPPRFAAADGGELPRDLFVLRRELDDGAIVLAIANPFEQDVDVRLRIEGAGLYALDTATGRVVPMASESVSGYQVARLKLGPSGIALWAAVRERADLPLPAEPARSARVRLGAPVVERLSPNVLSLDYCDLTLGGETRLDIAVTAADTEVWRRHGFEQNAWLGVQYRRSFVERSFGPGSGFSVTYRFCVSPDLGPEAIAKLSAAVERPWLYTIELNGRTLDFSTSRPYFDEQMRMVGIGPHVKADENELRLTARPFNVLCEVVPVWILGEFALSADSPGFVIDPPRALETGDWRLQGMPFYVGAVRYRMPFELERGAARLSVKLGGWSGSVARVALDGVRAGAIAWPPFELSVATPVAAGAHELAVDVVGNMKNLMGPHFNDGPPGVWSWRQCPRRAPDGTEYRFQSSGMMVVPSVTAAYAD
jgi:hypothetical protein